MHNKQCTLNCAQKIRIQDKRTKLQEDKGTKGQMDKTTKGPITIREKKGKRTKGEEKNAGAFQSTSFLFQEGTIGVKDNGRTEEQKSYCLILDSLN